MWVPSCLVGFLWKPALHVFAFLWNAFSVTCFRGFFGGSGLFWDYILCQWTSLTFYLQLVSVVFWGVREIICCGSAIGRNCSQGKLKLIYMMMLLQAAMIVKSLPYPSTCTCIVLHYLLAFVYQLKCFGMQSPSTKECTAASSITRINDCLDSPVSLIPSGLYTNTSHT